MTLYDEPMVLDPARPSDDPRVLLARAAFLREVAADVESLVATSMRRRASELELTAWVLEVRTGS